MNPVCWWKHVFLTCSRKGFKARDESQKQEAKCHFGFLCLQIFPQKRSFLQQRRALILKYPHKSTCSPLDAHQSWEALHFLCIKDNCFCNQQSSGCDGVVLSRCLPQIDWTMRWTSSSKTFYNPRFRRGLFDPPKIRQSLPLRSTIFLFFAWQSF